MRGLNLSFSLILLFLFRWLCPFQAEPTITNYQCSANESNYPCHTYVLYRAMAPNLLWLAPIGDIFGVSRLMISQPSNISSPSSRLLPDQTLFISVTCSCNSSNGLFYANITYTINHGDTFYELSTHQFQNLTTYQSVEFFNPSLNPTGLRVGATAFFPVFCNCPSRTQLQSGINYLISYVYQPSDTLASIAARFGLKKESLIEVNGEHIHPWSVIFLPVSDIPHLEQPHVPPISKGNIEEKQIVLGLAIGLGISGFLLSILIFVTAFWFYQEILLKHNKQTRDDREKQLFRRWGKNFMSDVSNSLDKFIVYKIEELRRATSGFNQSCIIEGSVYKGSIGGVFYAIKKMKWNASEELKILQKVNHGNLVRLEGFCIHPEVGTCYLVYEYVENGCLGSWLHMDNRPWKLNWKTRLQIAMDVANGLQYIHEHTRPTVVHKGIKTSNILLDRNMRAKIANFGLAKTGCNAVTMHIVGSHGYMAPEYLTDGVVTTKMDVFAFGVVLLELVSGKEATDEEGKPLWMNIEKILEGNEDEKEERLKGWVDEFLLDDNSCSIESIINVMTVAIACVQRDPSMRPTMVEIVYTLSKDEGFCLECEDGLSSPVSAR